jgi:TPR repeat protein
VLGTLAVVALLIFFPYLWLKIGAETGNSESMYKLGDWYKNAWGVFKNYEAARKWYQLAANAGNPWGMCDLADMYKSDRNWVEAKKWYEKAAEAGIAWGMYDLAELYESDLLGAPDYAQAHKWYQKVVEKGDEPPKKAAEEKLEKLRRLPP